jgi:hypothetical protein
MAHSADVSSQTFLPLRQASSGIHLWFSNDRLTYAATCLLGGMVNGGLDCDIRADVKGPDGSHACNERNLGSKHSHTLTTL